MGKFLGTLLNSFICGPDASGRLGFFELKIRLPEGARMSGLAVGTIVSKRYLPFARVLGESFRHYHPGIPFYVLLIDEIEGCFDADAEPFELIPFGPYSGVKENRFRFLYSEQELTYALTPFFLRELLSRGHDRAVFFKQESLVTGKLTPLWETLETCSILLAPHLLAPLSGAEGISRELNILLSGVFNVGCLGVRNTPTALRFLNWWEDRLQDHCRHDVANGMHFEQRWLDLVPAYFEDVKFCRDSGINVGHWNLPERVVRETNGGFTVDGQPCRFVRFSGYDPANPEQPTRYNQRLHSENLGPIRKLFSTFHQRLEAAGYWESQTWSYSHARFDNGVPIPAVARQLYRDFEELPPEIENPFETRSSKSFYQWLKSPAGLKNREGPPFRLTPLWQAIYDCRPDLQAVFPNVQTEHFQAFHHWTMEYGLAECGLAPEFLMATPKTVLKSAG